MPRTAVQRARGTAAQTAALTGLAGEVTVNTSNWTLHVHDAARPGGVPVTGGLMHALGWGFRAGSNTHATANRTALANMFAAITAAGSGTILFPDGDFYIDPQYASTVPILNVPSNTTILMGKRTRLITHLGGGTETHIIFRIRQAENVRIVGGELVGDPTAAGLGIGIAVYGLLTGGVQSKNITIDGTICRSFSWGGYFVEDGDNIRVHGMECYANKYFGGVIARGSNMRFSHCAFSTADGSAPECGFNVETEGAADIEDIHFDHCLFQDNAGTGLYVHKGSGAGRPTRVTANHCVFDGNGGIGLRLIGVRKFRATGCEWIGNTGDNVYCELSRDVQINGYRITNGAKGLYVLSSQHVVASEGKIEGTTDSAVEVRNDDTTNQTERVSISDTEIEDTAEYGVSITGANCTVNRVKVNKCEKDGILLAGENNVARDCEAYAVGDAADDTYRGFVETGFGNRFINCRSRKCQMSQTGTAQAGAAGSITLASTAPATNDILNGYKVMTTGGTGSGQTRYITDYNGTTKVATVSPIWDTNPDNTTTYEIVGTGSEGKEDDTAKSTAPNLPRYGMLLAGTQPGVRGSDLKLSGKTANFLDGGTGSSLDPYQEDGGFFQAAELAADAAAPAANGVRVYATDTGGKTQLVARFATGAVQQIAVQP